MFAKSKHSKKSENSLYPDSEIINNTPSLINGKDHAAPHALTAQEVLNSGSKKTEYIPMHGAKPELSPLESLRTKVIQDANKKKASKNTELSNFTASKKAEPKNPLELDKKSAEASSLHEKCMPYINEGGGNSEDSRPDYSLESFEDIIRYSKSKASALLKQLNLMGTVTFDDLSVNSNDKAGYTNKSEPAQAINKSKPLKISVESIPLSSELTQVIPTISDIDKSSETMEFGSIPSAEFEDISSNTKALDLTNEIFDIDETENHQIETEKIFEPEQFKVANDYLSFTDAKRVGADLLKISRASGIKLIITFILTAALTCGKIPFIHDALYRDNLFFSLISSGLFFIICLVNFDSFIAIKTLFTPRKLPESAAAITAAATIIYGAYALATSANPYQLILFSSITFFIKCISVSMRNTYILNNFRIIATKREKYAIKFIDDRQIAFTMAKNTVEGDTLIGAGNKCFSVQEFLKHTRKDSAMNGVLGIFTIISIVLAALASSVYGLYNSSVSSAISVFAVMICLAFFPTIFFTDILPLSHANKKLNKCGAMIAGAKTAVEIELANAVAAKTTDIFPAGTITLYNMQSLYPNSIDQTILDATAISKQIESPLFSIFNGIAETGGNSIPIADSVKYEDRMGISGWIDNRRVFIGNRTLLEAHGIKVPSIETDKKILRNGYFPVYVTSDNKACALLIIKYNVDRMIASELQKLSSSGVMILLDSCDPNITSEMVCDYFGLYEGAVHIMGISGSQLYKNSTLPEDGVSSGAAYKGDNGSIFSIFNFAAKIKRSITSLTVFHIIASLLMAIIYVYSSFINGFSPLESGTIFLYMLVSLIFSYIIALFNK